MTAREDRPGSEGASEPEALRDLISGLGLPVARIGMEAGPLSQWLREGLVAGGFEVVLLETRHVKAALSAMTVKTDRKTHAGSHNYCAWGGTGRYTPSRPVEQAFAILKRQRQFSGREVGELISCHS